MCQKRPSMCQKRPSMCQKSSYIAKDLFIPFRRRGAFRVTTSEHAREALHRDLVPLVVYFDIFPVQVCHVSPVCLVWCVQVSSV